MVVAIAIFEIIKTYSALLLCFCHLWPKIEQVSQNSHEFDSRC